MARHRDKRAGTAGGTAARSGTGSNKLDRPQSTHETAPQIDELGSGKWSRLSAAAVFDPRVTAPMLRVLAAIGIYADKGGTAFPAVGTLAIKLDLDPRHVQRTIRKLEAAGYLATLPRQRTQGGWSSNLYHLNYPAYNVRTPASDTVSQTVSSAFLQAQSDTVPETGRVPVCETGKVPVPETVLTSPSVTSPRDVPSAEADTMCRTKDEIGVIVAVTDDGWPRYEAGESWWPNGKPYYEVFCDALHERGETNLEYALRDEAGTYGESHANARAFRIASRREWVLPTVRRRKTTGRSKSRTRLARQ